MYYDGYRYFYSLHVCLLLRGQYVNALITDGINMLPMRIDNGKAVEINISIDCL